MSDIEGMDMGLSAAEPKQPSPFEDLHRRIESTNSRLSDAVSVLSELTVRLEGPKPTTVAKDDPEVPTNSILSNLNTRLDTTDKLVNRVGALVHSLDEIIR